MSLRPRDTSPEAAAAQTEAFRRAGPEGRLRMALEMSEEMARVVDAGVRVRHPDYSDDEVRLAGIRIRLGEGLFRAVYPNAKVEP